MKKLTEKHKESLKLGWIKRKEKGLGIPWNKGKKHSEETKENLKKAWIKRKEKGLGEAWNKGKRLSKEHAEKCRMAMLGKKHSKETKKKMSEKRSDYLNAMWMGGRAGYRALHTWIERKKGKAKNHLCVHCGKQAKHWANINHVYDRDIDKYIPLCVKCHKKFDGKKL